MIDKILRSVILSLAFGLSAAQAAPVPDTYAVATFSAVETADIQLVTVQHDRNHARMTDCCQSSGEQAGCQHCTDNGCESGTCGSCSHCLTALMHSPFDSSDADPAYRQMPVNYFLTIYQAIEPRPPQA